MKKPTFDNQKNLISESVRSRRLTLHLSQSELAAKLQCLGGTIDQQMVSRVENNLRFVTDFELVLFAKALKTTPDALLAAHLEESDKN